MSEEAEERCGGGEGACGESGDRRETASGTDGERSGARAAARDRAIMNVSIGAERVAADSTGGRDERKAARVER